MEINEKTNEKIEEIGDKNERILMFESEKAQPIKLKCTQPPDASFRWCQQSGF